MKAVEKSTETLEEIESTTESEKIHDVDNK